MVIIEKAISEWEIVLNLDPENERAYTSLQRAKAGLKNTNNRKRFKQADI